MAQDDTPSALKAKIEIHYIKEQDYREVPCHGAIGGIAPRGDLIWMSIYSERNPIPRMVEYQVDPPREGEPLQFNEGEAVPSYIDTRYGVIRQIAFSTFMDLETAQRVHKWLGDRIAQVEKGKA